MIMDISDEIFDQITIVWDAASDLRRNLDDNIDIKKIKRQCDKLSVLTEQYETAGLESLPKSTLLLAKEIIFATNQIVDGYIKLHLLA